MIPVVIMGSGQEYSTYALMDEGSTITMMTSSAAKKIGVEGPVSPLSLQGVSTMVTYEAKSEIVTIYIRSIHQNTKRYKLTGVRTIQDLRLPTQNLLDSEIAKWPHLNTLPCKGYKNITPEILIGQDHWELSLPIFVRTISRTAPVASYTALGWAIHGRMGNTGHVKGYTSCVNEITNESDYNGLNEINNIIKNYFLIDSIGIMSNQRKNIADERAMKLLQTNTTFLQDRWCSGLLWKEDCLKFPNTYGTARKRLELLEKKLNKEPVLKSLYIAQMDHLIHQGYAQKLINPTLKDKTWYLPHFPVQSASKPGKVRIVFDAAAKTQGICLNDKLLPGPDLLKNLPGVLMRFRQRPIAFKGDIKEMFLQIKIRDEDRQAQSFLWRNCDLSREPEQYIMTSMVFGAVSSPCTAMYIKNMNAKKHEVEYPKACHAIINKHYMDDYLDSVETEEEARELIAEVTEVHRRGGFEIRGWSSNYGNLLRNQEGRNQIIFSPSTINENTLGLQWNQISDRFVYEINNTKIDRKIITPSRIPTKREMLRIIMSIFDPLGILTPFTIRSKILLQNVWRSGITWDEQLKKEDYLKWKEWAKDLDCLEKYSVQRCYYLRKPVRITLHVFCDASEKAYSVVAYWRLLDENEKIEISFICGKARVAPLKIVSIPRLELQAALMGARMAKHIMDEHEYKIDNRIFWTDSQTVLKWIQGDPRSYQTFVAHRLGEIDQLSNPMEWRWVPTAQNPADDSTRENKDPLRWIRGPNFLMEGEETWPIPRNITARSEDLEIRPRVFHVQQTHSPLPDINRFSKWLRLIRCTARLFYIVDLCKGNSEQQINRKHLQKAENIWIRQVQLESFTREMEILKKGLNLPSDSRIRNLTPILDKDGLMRVGGRVTKRNSLSIASINPVVLDGHHKYTRLLIHHYHEQAGHGSTEMVVNELRQRYWVINLRRTVRTVASQCQRCRIARARETPPRMGDLPVARISHHIRPFTHCGMDYFGPMSVTVGRRKEKRWGVLFTCMSTRAIHLELANNLSTDSTIMAIRRMASRRGYPEHVYSDNGTNMHGADNELKAAYRELTGSRLQEFVAPKFQWHFNPPASPHMGGSWERLVKSVKVAIKVILRERSPKEETLMTLLTEVEHLVNSRPLTHVSTDHRDQEALTPNHFLIGKSSGFPISIGLVNDDLISKKQWRISQRLTDLFWKRWIKEYLPTLIPREKWLRETRPVKVNDIVVIVDPSLPRNTWPKGIVVASFPGRDGRIRVVDVRTTHGIFRRPVTKLVVLPTDKVGVETSTPGGGMSATD